MSTGRMQYPHDQPARPAKAEGLKIRRPLLSHTFARVAEPAGPRLTSDGG